MIKILIFLFLFVGCYDDLERDNYCHNVGAMKCEENNAYMCDHENIWRINRDCNVLNKTCIYNEPENQMGFINIATCE